MTSTSNKPHAKYVLAYAGSRTAKGGICVGTSLHHVTDDTGDYACVLVGDKVRYADGSEAVVLSGAGTAATLSGKRSVAVVGSHVSGGDHIVSTPIVGMELLIDEDARPAGFLVPAHPSELTEVA